jgi:RNase P subunit RPR2
MKPGRFLVVTCALCGFTEFYDMSLFAEERQAAAEETPAAIPNPQKGIP